MLSGVTGLNEAVLGKIATRLEITHSQVRPFWIDTSLKCRYILYFVVSSVFPVFLSLRNHYIMHINSVFLLKTVRGISFAINKIPSQRTRSKSYVKQSRRVRSL